MKIDLASYGRAFAPGIVQKAIVSFDKATIVIISACWGGAIMLMLFALYTINASVTAKKNLAEALATEPSLPKMVNRPPEANEIKPIVERLQKRYADVTFNYGSDKSVTVSAQDGSKFRTWLTVLSYIDTISPQYQWQIKELCVGLVCGGNAPMKAVLTAQKISFTTSAAGSPGGEQAKPSVSKE